MPWETREDSKWKEHANRVVKKELPIFSERANGKNLKRIGSRSVTASHQLCDLKQVAFIPSSELQK